MEKTNKKFSLFILIILIALVLGATLFIIYNPIKREGAENNNAENNNQVNLLESKEPAEQEKKLITVLPVSFKANYISFQDYSLGTYKTEIYPHLESWVENGEIACDETSAESSLPLRINKKEINGKKYCVAASSEGAAGSVYTQYSYSTVIGDNVYVVNFLARYPQCMNYPEKESNECISERESFNLDILVNQEIEKAQS